MDINLSEVFKEMLESQIKKAELEINKEKESALCKIQIKIEDAASIDEIESLEQQTEHVDAKFEQKKFRCRTRLVKEYLTVMSRLMKNMQKVYWKELKNTDFRKEGSR
jgi:hypothetical protein